MVFREVGVHEIKEVLRLWLRRRQKGSAQSHGCRGWTARRFAGMWKRPVNAVCRQVRQLPGSGEGSGQGRARSRRRGHLGDGEQDEWLTATVTATASATA